MCAGVLNRCEGDKKTGVDKCVREITQVLYEREREKERERERERESTGVINRCGVQTGIHSEGKR